MYQGVAQISENTNYIWINKNESKRRQHTPFFWTAEKLIGWVESCSGVLVSDVPETVLSWSSIFPLLVGAVHSSESLMLEFSLLASCQLKINFLVTIYIKRGTYNFSFLLQCLLLLLALDLVQLFLHRLGDFSFELIEEPHCIACCVIR